MAQTGQKYRQGALPILVVEPHSPTIQEAANRLSQDAKLQVFKCKNPMEVVTELAELPCGLVILYAARQEDIVKHVQLMKLIQPQIKKGRVRVILNTGVQQVKALSLMNYYGTSETIGEPIQARALLFKLQRHIKNLQSEHAEKLGQKESGTDRKATQQKDNSQLGRREERKGPKIRYRDAIKIQSDCWLVSRAQVKQIGKRWVIKLSGPGTTNGIWAKLKGDENAWIWKPHLSSGPTGQDPFVKDEGAWVFRGQRPDFQEDMWWFISNHPELSFINGSEVKAQKIGFESDSQTLLLSKDSLHAARLLPQIRESIKATTRALSQEGAASRSSANKENEANAIEWLDALKLKSDCWLFDDKIPRKINARWVIRATGPGPSAGRWIETKKTKTAETSDNPGERESFWSWTPNQPDKDPFIPEKGSWVFFGRQPKFETDHWLFIADRPNLGFYVEGELFGIKFETDPQKKLKAAKDSQQALAKMPEMRKSHGLQAREKVGDEENLTEYGRAGTESQALAGYGKSRGGPQADLNREVRVPRGAFGDLDGIWEKANAGQKGRVWSVFIPSAWMNAPLTQKVLDAHRGFHVYRGPKMPWMDVPKAPSGDPVLDEGYWVFALTEPKQHRTFKELPRVVAEFLSSLVNGIPKPVEETAEEMAEAEKEEKALVQKLNSPEDQAADSKTSGPAVDATGTRIDKLADAASVPDPSQASSAASEETASKPARALESIVASEQHEKNEAGEDTPPTEDQLTPTEAGQSTLSPLGLALIASELSGSPQLGSVVAARRLCRYLSRYLKGVRVEIWVEAPSKEWLVLATSDGGNGLLKQWATRSLTSMNIEQQDGHWIAPVAGRGRIVTAPTKGYSISLAEMECVSELLSGLMESLVQDPAA